MGRIVLLALCGLLLVGWAPVNFSVSKSGPGAVPVVSVYEMDFEGSGCADTDGAEICNSSGGDPDCASGTGTCPIGTEGAGLLSGRSTAGSGEIYRNITSVSLSTGSVTFDVKASFDGTHSGFASILGIASTASSSSVFTCGAYYSGSGGAQEIQVRSADGTTSSNISYTADASYFLRFIYNIDDDICRLIVGTDAFGSSTGGGDVTADGAGSATVVGWSLEPSTTVSPDVVIDDIEFCTGDAGATLGSCGNPTAPAGSPILRHFTTNSSERYLDASSTYAVPILSTAFVVDPVATNPEGKFYDVIGSDGDMKNMCLFNSGGSLTGSEQVTGTLMHCDGGNQAACTWTATSIEVVFGAGDVFECDNVDTLAVTAGDLIYLRMVTGTDPLDGDAKAIETYIEHEGTNNDEWFTSGGSIDMNPFGADTMTIMGIDNFTYSNAGQDARYYVPFGETHEATGLFMDRQDLPTSSTTYTLCRGDGVGTDANCGSAGTALIACTIATSGAQSCADATCLAGDDCLITDGEYAWVDASVQNASTGIGTHVAVRFENANQRWQSGGCQALDTANEAESGGGEGHRFGFYCNSTNGEDGCASRLDRAATTVNSRVRTDAAVTSGSFELSMREWVGAAGSAVDCAAPMDSVVSGGQTGGASGACTIDADNAYNWQFTPSSPVGAATVCWTTLWESM